MDERPKALLAADAPVRTKKSNYPEPFASRMDGRLKRPLGDLFGLTNFGVNMTTLLPGGESALLHRHTTQDEFVFVLEGELELHLESSVMILGPGMCAGFPKNGEAHALRNASDTPATYLEIGDRSPGDKAVYPADDLQAELLDGLWVFARKDGTPY